MRSENTVSTRGLREDATIWNEMVFDINTEYFEKNGGYEFSKKFYEDAFHFAEKEMGNKYIISAVMHADEKNEGLSLLMNKDVYHYHLHIVAIPIVDKEIRFFKRCKDASLIGTVKEVIHQISHSKKWEYVPKLDESGKQVYSENGKMVLIPSYGLLQDRFFEYMQDCGYKNFERGKKGSTAEWLPTIQYKVKQELQTHEKLKEMNEELKIEEDWLKQSIDELKPVKEVIDDVNPLGKKTITGKVQLSESEFDKLKNLANEGITSRQVIKEQNEQIERLYQAVNKLKDMYDCIVEEIRPYRVALKLAPQKVKDFFKELFAVSEKKREDKQLMDEIRLPKLSKKKDGWAR